MIILVARAGYGTPKALPKKTEQKLHKLISLVRDEEREKVLAEVRAGLHHRSAWSE
jgi:hypothetical protein